MLARYKITIVMKIKHLSVALCLMAGVMATSSCVGSFALFNKLAAWNKDATNSKILNEIIFLVISPAYAVCGAADILVLNSIEFWTGDNPMAMRPGETKSVMGQDGKFYAVTGRADGYDIKTPDGKLVTFIYDKKSDSWSKIENGQTTEVLRFNADGTVVASLENGKKITVPVSEQGVFEVRMAANDGMYFAQR